MLLGRFAGPDSLARCVCFFNERLCTYPRIVFKLYFASAWVSSSAHASATSFSSEGTTGLVNFPHVQACASLKVHTCYWHYSRQGSRLQGGESGQIIRKAVYKFPCQALTKQPMLRVKIPSRMPASRSIPSLRAPALTAAEIRMQRAQHSSTKRSQTLNGRDKPTGAALPPSTISCCLPIAPFALSLQPPGRLDPTFRSGRLRAWPQLASCCARLRSQELDHLINRVNPALTRPSTRRPGKCDEALRLQADVSRISASISGIQGDLCLPEREQRDGSGAHAG